MEENEKCPHADLIYQYGIDAKHRTTKPWLFYYFYDDDLHQWIQCQEHPVWASNLKYKRMEPSVNIQPIKLPRPIEEAPIRGTKLYIFTPESDKGWDTIVWTDTYEQNVLLKNKALHLYKDYCLQWVNWWQQHIIKGE